MISWTLGSMSLLPNTLKTIISSKIQHESYDFLGRLEELAQQEGRREKALVVGTAAALAVGLLAYIVK